MSPPLALNDIGALSTVLWGEGSYSEQGAEIDVIPTPAVLSKAISHHEGHEVDKAETVSKLRLRWRTYDLDFLQVSPACRPVPSQLVVIDMRFGTEVQWLSGGVSSSRS